MLVEIKRDVLGYKKSLLTKQATSLMKNNQTKKPNNKLSMKFITLLGKTLNAENSFKGIK